MEVATTRTQRQGRAPEAPRHRTDHWGWGGGQAVTDLRLVGNPVLAHDRELGEAIESILHGLLDGEEMGRIEVRFRICRDAAAGFRFICKVEGSPVHDPEREGEQWRWWSPLLETAGEFEAALREGVDVRRQRAVARRPHAKA